MNIWIINHYANITYFDEGGRHYSFAKYLRLKGHTPVVFCSNAQHGEYKCYFDNNDICTEKKQDTIDVYEYGQSGLRVAVEYSVMKSEKKSNKYFAFDNPRLQMITSGKWEIDIYPHYPSDDYSSPIPKEILYIFYIEFEGSLLQCEIINKTKNKAGEDKPCIFLFIHPKTTPLKEDNINLVYSQTPNPKPNYRRTITRATNNLERKIQQFFARDKVFYSDNETGEIMRNYIAWCKS